MIVVTGGAGFIGSAFLWKLNREGIDDIIVVDQLGTSDKWRNLVRKRFTDYFDKDEFIRLIEEGKRLPPITAIVHMGACSDTQERDASFLMRNNYKFTLALAKHALANNIRFVYASSAATYGDGEFGYSDEDTATPDLRPRNMYAFSKQAFDLWALRTGASKKMAGIKFFNVFGPNEYHKENMASVVFKSFNQIHDTGKVKLFKSYKADYKHGEQKRDFVYVKDCVDAMFKLMNNNAVNGIFNLGTGNARTWNDLARAVFAAMAKQPKIEFIEMPEAMRDRYQYFTQADMAKLRKAGIAGEFPPLEETVADYVKNYLLQDDPYL